MTEHLAYYKSEVGTVTIAGNEDGITWMHIDDRKIPKTGKVHPSLKKAVQQVDEYFRGERKKFDLKLNPQPEGTEFQQRVWKELLKVPYGKTASYHDIAKRIGKPNANRAVGNANHQNRIPLIIPCHRIIGSDGKLTGYGGATTAKEGLWRKEWLLKFESE